MNIGVLTQPLKNNYGGLLQAYALQKVLEELGHSAIVLDRHKAKVSTYRKVGVYFKNFLRGVFGEKGLIFFPNEDQIEFISQNTSQFIKENIKKTEILSSEKMLKQEFSDRAFNALIVGSDQVWRPKYSIIEDYFLGFVKTEKNIKRIAYSASFGVDEWEFSSRQTKNVRKLIKKFDAISVREDSGVDLCKRYLGVDVSQTLDPTMLLSIKHYRMLALKSGEQPSFGDLVVYILDDCYEKRTFVQTAANDLNLSPLYLMPPKLSRETQRTIGKCIFPSVNHWLNAFLHAKFVITDSFHGCVFSILFNIPFMAIGNKDRGLSRFKSLLKQFRLEDRLILSSDNISVPQLQRDIDWDGVNERREALRASSLEFLVKSLS